MPNVLRKNGFQIIIWTHDHLPIHLHIFKGNGELIVNLGNDEADISIRDN